MSSKLFTIALVVLVAFAASSLALPNPEARSNSRFVALPPPRLEDTLAVAKSPLEPVTLAVEEALQPAESFFKSTVIDSHKQTTRSLVLSDVDMTQESEITSPVSVVVSELNDAETSSSSANIANSTSESPQESPVLSSSPSSSSSASDIEKSAQEMTTQPAEVDNTNPMITTAASEVENTTTTTAASITEPNSVVKSEESSTSENKSAEPSSSESPTSTSDEEPSTTLKTPLEGSPETEPSTTTPEPSTETAPVTSEVSSTSSTSTTEVPTSTPESDMIKPTTVEAAKPDDESKKIDKDKEILPNDGESESITPTSPISESPEISTASSSATTTTPTPIPTTETVESTSNKQDVSAITDEPTTTSTSTTTTAPSRSTTTTEGSAQPSAPLAPEIHKEESQNQKSIKCNSFLPSYEPDELQKVYREETTFKNGTIRGKFTYINYDQRYRLVHYTRQPYGPVKIDVVEELSPLGSNGSSTVTSRDDIPNSELQIRNLLPKTMYGFPFVTSSGAYSPSSNAEDPAQRRNGDFLYAPTASSVGVNQNSVRYPDFVHGQRRLSVPNVANSFAVNPFDHQMDTVMGSWLAGAQDTSQSNPLQSAGFASHIPKSPDSSVFHQYDQQHEIPVPPVARQAIVGSTKQSNSFAFQTHTQHQQPSYSVENLPIYQVQYRHIPLGASAVYQTSSSDYAQASSNLAQRPAGQHHGHEHFIAPFMLALPVSREKQHEKQQRQQLQVAASPSLQIRENSQPSSERVKLRIKTSKELNLNRQHDSHSRSGTKSAQLKQQQPGGLPAATSNQNHGTQHHGQQANHQKDSRNQQRQRSGKQNHELRATINTRPVVYHVLANNPSGSHQSSNVHRNQQSYAMAYDHDN